MNFFCDDGSTYVKLAWWEEDEICTLTTGNSFRDGWKTDLFGSDKVFNFLINGKKYTHDIASTASLETTHVNYQYSDANLLAVHCALLSSGVEPQPIDITVTLPVTEFFTEDAQPNLKNIERKKANLLRNIELNKGAVFSITSVTVMPESLPAVLPSLIADDVSSLEKSLVVDLGGTTLDCGVIVGAFESVSTIKGFSEIGTSKVTQAVLHGLAEASTACSYYTADQIVRNAHDEDFLKKLINDVSHVPTIQQLIRTESRHLAGSVGNVIENFNGIHRIYLTGGGAELIYEDIKNTFSQQKVKKIANAQLALVTAMITSSKG